MTDYTPIAFKVGDRVRIEFWAGEWRAVEGTIEAVDPCDDDPCDTIVILKEDNQMAYYGSQVREVLPA